jgi:hypothetical protein
MSKSRILIATGLVCIAATFVSTSMLWAASKLTPKQQKAKSKCSLQFMSCTDACGVVGLSLAYWPCQAKCETAYNRCMDAAGIPRDSNPPPKGGRGHRVPVDQVTGVATATPTPHKPKLSPDRTGSSVAPVKGGTPTPTPSPRPKATASPGKKSNG